MLLKFSILTLRSSRCQSSAPVSSANRRVRLPIVSIIGTKRCDLSSAGFAPSRRAACVKSQSTPRKAFGHGSDCSGCGSLLLLAAAIVAQQKSAKPSSNKKTAETFINTDTAPTRIDRPLVQTSLTLLVNRGCRNAGLNAHCEKRHCTERVRWRPLG